MADQPEGEPPDSEPAKPSETAPDQPAEPAPAAKPAEPAPPEPAPPAPVVDLAPATVVGIGPMGIDPAARDAAVSIVGVHAFPDDGPLAATMRRIDHAIGQVEQGVLFGILAAIVLTAAGATLSDKLFHYAVGRWWFTVVRDGTFAIGMLGAVFATHQQRHLAMDLVSRQLPPQGRLILGIVLKLFVIAVMALLFRSGLAQRDTVGDSGESFISDKTIVTMIPIAAALIIVHSILHLLIDFDYLMRAKQPPERARSGH